MKQITFTISTCRYGIIIKTSSKLADIDDEVVYNVSAELLNEMNRLTAKYNEKDIAVLFEVE